MGTKRPMPAFWRAAATRWIVLAMAGVVISGSLQTRAVAYPRPGRTDRVSVSASGAEATFDGDRGKDLSNADCQDGDLGSVVAEGDGGDITPDGRYVAFTSVANNLVAGDSNKGCDVFVRDLKTGEVERVSVTSNGEQAEGLPAIGEPRSILPTISYDGRFVTFASDAVNLITDAQGHPVPDANLGYDVFLHDRKTKRTQLLSHAYLPKEGGNLVPVPAEGTSTAPSISGDGRRVAFMSNAVNLTAEVDNPLTWDVFVINTRTGAISIVSSVEPSETSPLCITGGAIGSRYPSISGDGRSVGFVSDQAMIPDDQNGGADYYVRDLRTGKLKRASVASDGSEIEYNWSPCNAIAFQTWARQLSSDGSTVVFTTPAFNLIPSDSNGAGPLGSLDVYVHEMTSGRTQRVSVASTGAQAEKGSYSASISPDGRFVTFGSGSEVLAGDDDPLAILGDSKPDAFVYDRLTGQLDPVSVALRADETTSQEAECGGTNNKASSHPGAISRDGRYVVFVSCADNLVQHDGNQAWDAFVRQHGDPLEVSFEGTSRVSIEGDERFSRQGYVSDSDPVADAQGTGAGSSDIIRTTVVYRPERQDLFVREELQEMPRLGDLLGKGTGLYGFRFSAEGVHYEVRAQQLPSDLLRAQAGTFLLFRCDPVCTLVSRLEGGGYGTTGEEVVFTLPMAEIGLSDGGELSDISAYAGAGTLATGPFKIFDEIKLEPHTY